MNPSTHVIFGFFVGLILFFIFPSINLFELGIFFFSSFLIDFDHYLYFVFVKKKFGLKQAYKWFLVKKTRYLSLSKEERKKHYISLCLFHGIEPIILFILLGYFLHNYFYFIAGGMVFHLVCDLIYDLFINGLFSNKYSILYAIFKTKKLIYLN